MTTSNSDSSPSSACPVDHKAREAWLRAAESQQQQQQQPQDQHPYPNRTQNTSTRSPQTTSQPSSSWLSRLFWSAPASNAQSPQPDRYPHNPPRTRHSPQSTPKISNTRLSNHRETSSIPRGGSLPTAQPQQPTPAEPPQQQEEQQHPSESTLSHASPNAQTSDPIISPTGHWMYPSEAQFFTALARKHGADGAPPPATMSAVIPIHNAVNERTWHEILGWESLQDGQQDRKGERSEPRTRSSKAARRLTRFRDASERCGGPKLVSFSGELKTRMTPRARVYSLLGYQEPFDRHDWVVERCGGKRVEYVIDFYEGRASRGAGDSGGGAGATQQQEQQQRRLNFFLDVRPKLNTWEGVKMRVARYWGLS
ncbi:MAG: Cytochrome c1 heme lyase [Alyxoria varia]|nr:MAG: Cytochrome c1 heme lyase [Alyxoria varia]